MRLIMLLLLASAYSVSASLDAECKENGFQFGIARYIWEDEWIYQDGAGRIEIEGDRTFADWRSSSSIAGAVAFEEGRMARIFPGGREGILYSKTGNLTTVSFCGNGELPEFSGLAAGAAAVVAIASFLLIRKR
jgi:hypothetical protein